MKNELKKIFRPQAKTLRSCPLCSWRGRRFQQGGVGKKLRIDSRCPRCGSMERHRLAFMVASNIVELDYSAVLHVAPEPQIEKFLRSRSQDYLSIDLFSKNAMAKMDITYLDLKDCSKTLVWISHVLEHVEHDDLAISEIYRVLAPGGVSLIQVPIWCTHTYEDFSIISEEERLRTFYQKDHVRLYGMDIVDRLALAGFEVSVVRSQDFGPDKLIEHGLSFASTNEVFIAKKPRR